MRIVLIHNHYQLKGGEDIVFSAESTLLREQGHTVIEFTDDNNRINGGFNQAQYFLWSQESYSSLLKLIRKEKPDLAHFHNTFFVLSPSVYYACCSEGIPVVQTLHNYRLLCPAATFFRDGKVCEDCLHQLIPWPGVKHRCYHKSFIQTAAVAGMLSLHQFMGTWRDKIDLYIALTGFARQKFIQGGFAADKIVVKPNFIHPDPGLGTHQGKYALFVGRLSDEKGIRTLIEAWDFTRSIPLKIVGIGPLYNWVKERTQNNPDIEMIGHIERDEIFVLMKNARFLVFPSECFEGFPTVIGEAFASGLPVAATNLGSSGEIVTNRVTGLFFSPGAPDDLASTVSWAWEHPDEMAEMGQNARREYEAKYTCEHNYPMLMEIYRQALAKKDNNTKPKSQK
jgi:glycosyltransferase involved in cell wall biosynthesis